MSTGENAPNSRHACAACKHQRKKCENNCIFAPYFPAKRANNFKDVHKIFGVKNLTNILEHLLSPDERGKAMESLEWEARAWKDDPINGPLGVYRERESELKLLRDRQLSYNPPQQNIVPLYQANNSTVPFNPNPAAPILPNTNVATTAFGYANYNQNFGLLDVSMNNNSINNHNNYGGFMPVSADTENHVHCYAINPQGGQGQGAIHPQGGQGRSVLRERGSFDVVAQAIHILPKQNPQINHHQTMDSFNQLGRQLGVNERRVNGQLGINEGRELGRQLGINERRVNGQLGINEGRVSGYYDRSPSGSQGRGLH